MIYGEIKELNYYRGISEYLDKAIDYILSGKYKEGTIGKNLIDGDNIYFNLPDSPCTKDINEGCFEGHKKYIDIHIVIEGKEKIAYFPNSKASITKEYNENEDYELYSGEAENFFILDSNKFLILFPEEPHMALIKVKEKPEVIKKVIFKILVK